VRWSRLGDTCSTSNQTRTPSKSPSKRMQRDTITCHSRTNVSCFSPWVQTIRRSQGPNAPQGRLWSTDRHALSSLEQAKGRGRRLSHSHSLTSSSTEHSHTHIGIIARTAITDHLESDSCNQTCEPSSLIARAVYVYRPATIQQCRQFPSTSTNP
jgi:hypothetical protein